GCADPLTECAAREERGAMQDGRDYAASAFDVGDRHGHVAEATVGPRPRLVGVAVQRPGDNARVQDAPAAIATLALTKDYGMHRGIFDLDLTIRQGEVFGFLGPNGAGKTTT